jgi:hypothetical protein
MQRSAESATTTYLVGGHVMLALLILAATATTLDAQAAELTFDMRLQDGGVLCSNIAGCERDCASKRCERHDK